MKDYMSDQTSPIPNHAMTVSETYPDAKKFAWCLVMTATMYMFADGPPVSHEMFAAAIVMFGFAIETNSAKKERTAIAAVMLIFLATNALYLVKPPYWWVAPAADMTVAFWIINKFLYVYAVAYFIAVFADIYVSKEKHSGWAVFLAFCAVYCLAMHITAEKAQESQQTIVCHKVTGNLCTPVHEALVHHEFTC